ncbi:MAG: biotin transporter BioY [Burkholderiaceae bacterium]
MSVRVQHPTLSDLRRPATHPLVWDASLVVAFSVLTGVMAQISLPLPFTPVPITGQTLGVLLTGALLGSRRGALAMLVYLLEGVGGLPVFALGHSGLAVMVGPTGGYLLSYPVAAFIVGAFSERGWDHSFRRTVAAMACGEVAIYALGLWWLARFVGVDRVVALGLIPFIPGDVAKLLLAAALLPSAWQLLRGTGRL